jgi:hypothetical protein
VDVTKMTAHRFHLDELPAVLAEYGGLGVKKGHHRFGLSFIRQSQLAFVYTLRASQYKVRWEPLTHAPI